MDREQSEVPRVEQALGTLMRAGVYGSALCLLAGLVAWLVQHESAAAATLLKAGLIALMAAPGMRVLISAVEAVRLKDWLHLAMILAVAGLLALAVTAAAAGSP
jgi:uncharacterized membrane protein